MWGGGGEGVLAGRCGVWLEGLAGGVVRVGAVRLVGGGGGGCWLEGGVYFRMFETLGGLTPRSTEVV